MREEKELRKKIKKESRLAKKTHIRNQLQPLYDAKDRTIHNLTGVVRKHQFLRLPILILLVGFIFIYHLLMSIFIQMRMKEKLSRVLAITMTVILVIRMIPSISIPLLVSAEDNLGDIVALNNNSVTVGAFTLSTNDASGVIDGTDYSYASNTLTIESGKALMIANIKPATATTVDHIRVNDNVSANLTLCGVNIDMSSKKQTSAIDLDKAAESVITLMDDTNNVLKAGGDRPGIFVPKNHRITFNGNGSLEVTGGSAWPGIGRNGDGDIQIDSGKITAIGGEKSAAIGGSYGCSGGIITINGGIIDAYTPGTQFDPAAIGGGADKGAAGTITIHGGIVKAEGSGWHGIGGGDASTSGSILIDGGLIMSDGIGTVYNNEKISTTIKGNPIILSRYIIERSHQDTWSGLIVDKREGKIYGMDSFTVTNDFTLPGPSVWTEAAGGINIESGKTLIIKKGVTVTNNRTMTIDGTLVNNGTLINNGTIKGSGSLEGTGTYQGDADNYALKNARSIPALALDSVTTDSVTLKEVTVTGDGDVTYGYATTNNKDEVLEWQSSRAFHNLTAGTEYYFFAKVPKTTIYQEAVSAGKLIATVPSTPALGAGFTIDYEAETATALSGYQISTTNNGSDWSTTVNITPKGSLYVRKAASGSILASAETLNTLLDRPTVQETISTENESSSGKSDGIITNLDSTKVYQYKLKTDSIWSNVAVGSHEITGLASGTYEIRYAPSSNAFSSAPTEVILHVAAFVKDPVASLAEGTYEENKMVTLSSDTIDAEIYYTTDGSIPSKDNGIRYTGAIPVTGVEGESITTTIQAIAIKNKMQNSAVKTFIYTISIPDTTAPTAEITVETDSWTSFMNTVTFGQFFKSTKEVTITANDEQTGVATIEYYLSDKELSMKEAKAITSWTTYTDTFSMNENSKQIIYARVTDVAGNITIVNSEGFVIYKESVADTTAITYKKNTGNNPTANVKLNGNTIKEIYDGNKTLVSGKDYTVSISHDGLTGTITFNHSYLESLAVSAVPYTLSVRYNPLGESYKKNEVNGIDQNEAPLETIIALTIKAADIVETPNEGAIPWNDIKDQVQNATEGTTVTVDMKGTTTIKGEILDTIKGKDVNVVFDLGNGIKWTVNGKDITDSNIADINLGIKSNTKAIPVDVVNTITGDKYAIQLSLDYEGEFGFKATLSINMNKSNSGYYANLFYYNKKTGKLEFMNAGKIDANGNVNLTFTHASDYTIVVSDNIMDDQTQNADPQTSDNSDIFIYVLLLVLSGLILVSGTGTIVLKNKK